MAHADKKSGTKSPEWWKHIRPFEKRAFWKKVRKACKVYKEVLNGITRD